MSPPQQSHWAPARRLANTAASDFPNVDHTEPCDDPWAITHRAHAHIDDDSAVIVKDAIVELTLARTPMALGDALAELHTMVSLLAQLHDWLPIGVASARNQGYAWADIASQLGVTASTARRRHRQQAKPPTKDPTR